MRTRVCALALVALSAGIGGCGESKEERAQQEICDARSDITLQVENLQDRNLAETTTGRRDAENDILAIEGDIEQIQKFSGDLADDRKSQVDSATKTFKDQVDSIRQSFRAAGASGASDAVSELTSAVKQLGASYQQALAPLDCPT